MFLQIQPEKTCFEIGLCSYNTSQNVRLGFLQFFLGGCFLLLIKKIDFYLIVLKTKSKFVQSSHSIGGQRSKDSKNEEVTK